MKKYRLDVINNKYKQNYETSIFRSSLRGNTNRHK